MPGDKAGGAGKKDEPATNAEKNKKKKPTPPDWDELYQDGDIATPKRDRYGPDEEPY
ncbi:hypothetical protein [Bradyrhizobium sp. ARR65]|uniref:hypothetical protein n=1 Tax=Bradyrhizobium sp. ARR65 TaxID=1040989 RepID=UPI000ACA808E|nr:hypothetical protein [Bradyrhizobium sp. ARR65]